MERLTAKQNEKIKHAVSVRDSARVRRETGLFFLEGARLCGDAAVNSVRVFRAFVTDTAMEKYSVQVSEILSKAEEGYVISDDVAAKLSDTQSTQGIFCLCRTQENTAVAQQINPQGKYIFLENVQDPGNLGTIIRTAEGAGATGIIMSKDTVDIYNPKTIRSTMGSLFRLPVCDDLSYTETLSLLKDNGIATYASVIDTDACSVRDFDFPKNCAVVIGNEGNGLTNEEASMCDKRITIKMSGNINSLNAAMAAGIILWEMTK